MSPSWWGPVLVAIGLLLFILGDYATLFVLLHFSLWIVIIGVTLSFIGRPALRVLAFPLGYLLTAIPLPVFLYNSLSSQLQLWSSALGVGFLQAIESHGVPRGQCDRPRPGSIAGRRGMQRYPLPLSPHVVGSPLRLPLPGSPVETHPARVISPSGIGLHQWPPHRNRRCARGILWPAGGGGVPASF
jgi:hypothetical protein